MTVSCAEDVLILKSWLLSDETVLDSLGFSYGESSVGLRTYYAFDILGVAVRFDLVVVSRLDMFYNCCLDGDSTLGFPCGSFLDFSCGSVVLRSTILGDNLYLADFLDI